MGIINSVELLRDAKKNGYAIGAFNVENMEMIMAVLEAAEETRSPVILQTTPSTIKYASLEYYLVNAKNAAEKATVPVVMHLDHGNSFELTMKAFRAGYSSIMIDGSQLQFEENIKLTKSVVNICNPNNVSVEGELGKVGGKEDDLENNGYMPFTDPQEACEFIERTGVDSLAIGIGTSHGVYKGTPMVNMECLSAIQKITNIPLVLHGTSGVPDEQVRECVRRGICKVNYATDLRIAYTNGIKKYISTYSNEIDPKKYLRAGMDEVRQYVAEKMIVVGAAKKA